MQEETNDCIYLVFDIILMIPTYRKGKSCKKKWTIVLCIRHNCFLQLIIRVYKEEKSCKVWRNERIIVLYLSRIWYNEYNVTCQLIMKGNLARCEETNSLSSLRDKLVLNDANEAMWSLYSIIFRINYNFRSTFFILSYFDIEYLILKKMSISSCKWYL